ncbi:MAG: hypothetical protein KC736_02195 [Candidatus Moranbacteria bacterium]|nr:hypothetical protein [Candidatus Moranbacteria bacterium]
MHNHFFFRFVSTFVFLVGFSVAFSLLALGAVGDPCQENGPTRFGTCQLPSSCSEQITDDLAKCQGTFVGGVSLVCCAGQTSPTAKKEGEACSVGGKSGVCHATCGVSEDGSAGAGNCEANLKCCTAVVTVPPGGTDCFSDFGGTCRLGSSCNSGETIKTGATGCNNPSDSSANNVCCVTDDGDGGALSCAAQGGGRSCVPSASCSGTAEGQQDCGQGNVCCNSGGGVSKGFSGWDIGGVSEKSGLPQGKIADIIVSFMEWLLGIFAFIAIIGFLIASVWYLTAAGDEGRIDTAKRAMIYSIIGVLVGLIGLVILFAAEALLSGDNVF